MRWEPSEPRARAARLALTAAAILASLGLAGFLIWRGWTARALVEPSVPPAEPALPVPAAGSVNVRVQVRVFRPGGGEEPIGTMLPRRVALELTGAGGQPYQARFDRAGLWVMETPPGEYAVALKQKDMGDWTWSLTGTGVAADPTGGWRVTVPPDRTPTIVVLLR